MRNDMEEHVRTESHRLRNRFRSKKNTGRNTAVRFDFRGGEAFQRVVGGYGGPEVHVENLEVGSHDIANGEVS